MKYAIFDGYNLINVSSIPYLQILKVLKKIQTTLPEYVDPKLYELKELHHIDERIAFEEEATIEYQLATGKWAPTTSPLWEKDTKYRIKPKPPTCQVKIGTYSTNISQVTIYRIDETFDENSKAYGVCVNTDEKEVTIITDRDGVLTHWNNTPVSSIIKINLDSWAPLS